MGRKVQTPRKEKIKPSWGITAEKDEVVAMETYPVRIIQYLRPSGMKRTVIADIDKEHADKAKGLIFSCELLPGNRLLIYGRKKDQTEEEELTEMASNGPGENEPNIALCRLIDRLCAA